MGLLDLFSPPLTIIIFFFPFLLRSRPLPFVASNKQTKERFSHRVYVESSRYLFSFFVCLFSASLLFHYTVSRLRHIE